MALRIELAPFEKFFVGKSVISNSHERARFAIVGETPVLRSKDVLTEEAAQTPLERLYRCVQQMYLEEAVERYQGSYLDLRVEAVKCSPELYPEIQAADELINAGEYYGALRRLKKLIRPEAFGLEQTQPENYVPRSTARHSVR